MLNITDVRFKKIGKGNFLGYAGITISDSIVIRGIKLFDSEKGKFIVMPGTRIKDQKRMRHISFPITEEARLELLDAIVKKYEEELSNEDEKKEETVED